MNRLLIVDDEREILGWLEELFTYEYPGTMEIYTAMSATQALELLHRIPFDVVLTDIKMPGMDGIRLFREIRENWPKCRVVFLTGYRNFDDIYELVQQGDIRYVLKSEDDETIMKAVSDSLSERDEMLKKERMLAFRKNSMEKAKFWLQREYIQKLLLHPEKIADYDNNGEIQLSIDMKQEMLLFLLRVEGNITEDGVIEDYTLLTSLEELLLSYLPKRIKLQIHCSENGYLMLLLQPQKADDVQWSNIFNIAKGALEYAQNAYVNGNRGSFCAVVSSSPIYFKDVRIRASQLKQQLISYISDGDEAILHSETLKKQQEEKMLNQEETPRNVNMLKYYLELRQKTEYMDLLSKFCQQMMAGEGRHNPRSMEIYYEIAVTLLQFINDNHIYEQLAFEIAMYKLLNNNEHMDWIEAGNYLLTLSEAIFHVLGNFENKLADRALARVTDYISSNLQGDLTLTTLAEIGGFNTSYLSRLFKQVYKVTITEYVLKKRMEEAKRLLVKTNEQIQKIAEKTGYQSSHSFSRAFRGYQGVSPMEYREFESVKTGKESKNMHI